MDLSKLGQAEPASAHNLTVRDDRAYWQRFQSVMEDEKDFPKAWLALQCIAIEKVVSGCIVLIEKDRFRPSGSWPEGGKQSDALMMVAEHALKEKRGREPAVYTAGSFKTAQHVAAFHLVTINCR